MFYLAILIGSKNGQSDTKMKTVPTILAGSSDLDDMFQLINQKLTVPLDQCENSDPTDSDDIPFPYFFDLPIVDSLATYSINEKDFDRLISYGSSKGMQCILVILKLRSISFGPEIMEAVKNNT